MDTLINSTDAAKMLGITKQSFSDGVKAGRFTPARRGKFGHPLFDPATVQAEYSATRDAAEMQDYARILPDGMRGGRPPKKDSKNSPPPKDVPQEVNHQMMLQAKYAKDVAVAQINALKFKVSSGLYMDKSEAKKQGVELAEMVMGVLLSWPSRLAPELASMRDSDEHDFLHRLEQEVNLLIIAIRQRYADAIKEKQEWTNPT